MVKVEDHLDAVQPQFKHKCKKVGDGGMKDTLHYSLREESQQDDVLVVIGSFHLMGPVRELLGYVGEEKDGVIFFD